MEVSLLAGLNEAQRAAVTSTVPVLQVLAPPGSGKTKTLTSRVAHLLAHRNLDPHNVICCTFTIKASREMRDRLRGLVGEALESKLIMGTFHSICRRYLAAYGNTIGIPKGFGIADSSDSKSMVKKIIKKGDFKIEPNTARNKISGCKARFRSVEVLRQEQAKLKHQNVNQQELIQVYEQYEAELQRNNLLDYDDLLLRCVDLLRESPLCVANVEAVLVDEFQDTNIVQFELMKLFASARNNVTIVGDPDQSIYGFRSAEIENLKRMRTFYPGTVVINLEENYRSAAALLNLAQEVIEQDKERPDKKLKSTHCHGTLPVLRRVSDPHQEGLWIASEIKRMMATTGGLFGPSDMAVLIRSGFLSLQIEKALSKAKIAYRMVGGMRFFDRAEIRLIIDYMRAVAHPDNNAAFLSIINVPSRKIGETTINALVKLGEDHSLSVWSVVQKIIKGDLTLEKKLSKPAQNDLAKLVRLLKTARDKIEGFYPAAVPGQLISYLVDSLKISEYLLQKYKDDHEDRMENIKELIVHAKEVASSPGDSETLPTIDGVDQQSMDDRQEALDQFLANIVLSSERENHDDDEPRVTISTIHSAKGLEWPVVFIPAVYEGSIPHSRAEDNDEERRLLYVAITRAKALLNMTYPRYSSREQQSLELTQFLPEDVLRRTAEKAPSFRDDVIRDAAAILQREMPNQEAIAQGLASIGENDSLEDDLWPLDGRPPLGPEQNVLLADPAKTGGQVLGGSQAHNHGYQTSMANANSFSTANTSMGHSTAFTTASQQMRTMNAMATVSTTNGRGDDKPKNPATVSGGPKGSIKSFFSSQSQTARLPAAEAARQAWTNRPSMSAPIASQSQPQPQLPAMPAAPARSQSDIPAQLAGHRLGGAPGAGFGRASAPGRVRLGGAGFKRPCPLPLEDVSPNKDRKKYHFLSSSPTVEHKDADKLGEVVDLTGESEVVDARLEKENQVQQPEINAQADGTIEPKKPSMLAGKPSSVPGSSVYPKKSLGVRRDFAPWSARKHK